MASELYGAIDLGGTSVRAIVADLGGNICGDDIRPSQAEVGLENCLAAMQASLQAAADEAGLPIASLRAVGIDSPGPVDVLRGVVPWAPQLHGWRDVPLVKEMSARFGVPVVLENDANAQALGEHTFGAGRGTQHMLFVTVSTGIGGGIIVDGRLYRGANGSAGELGHVMLDPRGPLCGCGARGCLEALASGTALARRGDEAAERNPGGRLAQARERDGRITADEVAAAAEEGDVEAREIFREAGHWLGTAFAGYVNIFNPQAIVVGGGVTRAAHLFLPEAESTMRSLAMSEPLKHVKLVIGELWDRAGVLGMIAWMRSAPPDAAPEQ